MTSRTRAIIILPRSFILLDEDVLIHPRFQGLFPTSQGPGNEDGADRVMPLKKQGTPIVFLLNIYLFSRAMFCIYMLILRAILLCTKYPAQCSTMIQEMNYKFCVLKEK